MSARVGYGLIGAGMMGQEHLKNIAMIPGASVVALFEPDELMRSIALALASEATASSSVGELISRSDVDALVIASPNHLHVQQLEEIARTRQLPVLVEKPLYVNPDEAARLSQVKSKLDGSLWVAMEYRYMPPIAKLVAKAEAATGGVTMLTIREHRYPFLEKVGAWNRFNRSSGGTLVEKCCHFFDLMRLILKSEPVRVMASAGQAVNHKAELHGGEAPDIWDHGYVIVDFASGSRAMLELCMFAEGSRYQELVSAIGPLGKIECFVPGPTRFWPSHLGAPPVPKVVVSPRDPAGERILEIPVDPALLAAGDHNGSTYYQHVRFNRAVRGEGPVEVTLDDGARAVALGLAAQESARTGRAIAI